MKLIIHPDLPAHYRSWLEEILPSTGEIEQPRDDLFTDSVGLECFGSGAELCTRLVYKGECSFSHELPVGVEGGTKEELELWLYEEAWRGFRYGLRRGIINSLEEE